MRPQVLRLAVLLAATVAMLSWLLAPAFAGTADPLDSPGALLPAGAPPPPAVSATAWLVADVDSGTVLAAQEARTPLAPASTLKLLTALALAPELDREQTWTAQHEDAAIDGSKVGLVPGSVYRVEDLLHGLLLGSGNDTAHALAGLVGGMDTATARMQQVADDLGATDTVVRNTSGLDAEGQVSTVVDLALIGRAVLADPELAQLVRTTRYRFPAEGTTFGSERPTFEIANHNRLLYGYDGALGLKNGYTVAAGGSFVGAVERDGRRYLVALLDAEGSTSELTRVLLDWAIANGPSVQPVATLPGPPAAPDAADLRDRERDQASRAERAPPGGQQESAPGEQAAATPVAEADGGWPGWATTTLGVLVLLAALVAVLRARVLLRRRARRRAQQRRAARQRSQQGASRGAAPRPASTAGRRPGAPGRGPSAPPRTAPAAPRPPADPEQLRRRA